MADMTRLGPGCDDDCGERGERGRRGRRGPTGPAGPAAGGLLKFSAVATPSGEGGLPTTSYLADTGFGFSAGPFFVAPNYPVAVAHSLVNMATNLLQGFVIPTGGSMVFELLRNGVPVPGFTITYGPGESGVKSVLAGPQAYAVGDTFDIQVTTSGAAISAGVDVSATVGVE